METESESNNKKRLAFLWYSEFDKGYRGGIPAADEWGKRVEFRCTAPFRPNPLQRTLYGRTLLPHIAVELIGAPLRGEFSLCAVFIGRDDGRQHL
jgi:hypothetical protein